MSRSTASSRASGPLRGGMGSGKSTEFELLERVDVAAGESLLRSAGYGRLRETNEPMWRSLWETMSMAKALGGSLPVRYYMHEAQEGFGRMKSEVMVTGVLAVPYVRMLREARAVLASAYYWDVDMANCQPWLLEQKLGQYKIPCPSLSRYVAHRDACILEVMTGCGVSRDEAKNLFIRLVFMGSVQGWLRDHPHASSAGVPDWVHGLCADVRDGAKGLLDLPFMKQLRDSHAKRGVSMMPMIAEGHQEGHWVEPAHRPSNPNASMLALYLQTLECECVRALVKAIHSDGYAVGGIIYDGVHVEKHGDEPAIPAPRLRAWEDAVRADTGLCIRLEVKAFGVAPEWVAPRDASARALSALDQWLDGSRLVAYEEAKALWEAHTFKVIKSGNYVREDPADGSRSVMSERQLLDSYGHLHYASIKQGDSGQVTVTPELRFINKWLRDARIRSYKQMVFMPPPLVPPPSAFNIWNGFAAERLHLAADSSRPPPGEAPSEAHPVVVQYLDFFRELLGESAKYFLDWNAQIFQQPAKKTGVALILKGQEGVGKNRATDLLRAMHGSERFLQTATPATTLYGRFNRLREGRTLVVINESSGTDNFAAIEVIKDMITCDEFQSEGKGTNAYTLNCFSRFLFTTNNDNILKVNPDSRRYVVIEVSSALKGDTEYFKRLSAAIDDADGRYAFYRYLMGRDISCVDWINDRPVTEYYMQMVNLNLPYEHQFIKQLMLRTLHDGKARIDGPIVKVKLDELFTDFLSWMEENKCKYDTSKIKFGNKMTGLVRDEKKSTGLAGVSKMRHGVGVVYRFEVRSVVQELVRCRWVSVDEV